MKLLKLKRVFIAQLFLILGLSYITHSARAAYPERPITVVVGYGAGGGADTLARLYAEKLAHKLKVPFVVENKTGAGATLAASAVARAQPDGYTLMVAPTAVFTITPNVRKTSYDPITDFTPISTIAKGLDVIIASNTLPANNIRELLNLVKKNPRKYSFASSGLATSTHLMGEAFNDASDTELLHVPYKSSNDYLPDLIEGRVALAFDPVLLNQVKAGKLKLLGMVSGNRSSQFPEIGTTKEAGIDMSMTYGKLWYGLVGPAGLPKEVTQRLASAVEQISKDPEVSDKLSATGIQADAISMKKYADKIKEDNAFYRSLIEKLNLKLDN